MRVEKSSLFHSDSAAVAVGTEALDVFNHCLPPRFVKACRAALTAPLVMFDRAAEMPGMSDLEERLRIMDEFPGYQQVLSLGSPAVEAIAGPNESPELARIGNDAQTEWVAAHPDRFPGFIASLPMNNPAAAGEEARRAIEDLGAVGVQLYTNVNGAPLDRPEFLEIIGLMAELDQPIWLHPLRASSVADYPGEAVSKYDIWWALGWPHETSVCASRLVFAGVFDRWPDLKIITHHAGGTIPLMEGRLDSGLALMGKRYPPEHANAAQTELKEKPLDAFRRFYADTATFGSKIAVECGAAFFGKEKTLFATDFPFAGIGEALQAAGDMGDAVLSGNARRLLRLTAR